MLNRLKHHLVEPFRAFKLRKELEGTRPILVYQMGKVASTSIHRSLEAVHDGWVIQLHKHEPHQATNRKLRIRMAFEWALKHNQPLDIITLTREPVGRNVAGMFENFSQRTGLAWDDPKVTLEYLRNYFLTTYDQRKALDWFDQNLKAHFGIDCYEKPFLPHGHATFSRNTVRVLAMQCELEDDLKSRLIRDFIQNDNFVLKRENDGSQKAYGDLYRRFKEEVKLPSDYLDMMCSSRYFRHFYSETTIAEVRRHWEGGQSS